MGIRRYSFDIFKPNWPKWKIKFADFILNILPVLYVRKTNKIIKKYEHLDKMDFMRPVAKEIGIEYEVSGGEFIPRSGAVTFVSNHPGGADVIGTMLALADYRLDYRILANKLICVNPVEDLVIPVDTMKKQSKVDLDFVHQTYRENKMVVFFAAGKNSRFDDNGVLMDRRWRTSFLDFAYTYKTPIIVMHIDSINSNLFYKIANIRQRFDKFKNVPLENMFQLREFYKQKTPVKIQFSEPIHFDEYKDYYDPSSLKKTRTLGDKLHDFCYQLNPTNTRFNINEPN